MIERERRREREKERRKRGEEGQIFKGERGKYSRERDKDICCTVESTRP
jgi:hypothetical protein